MCSKQVEGQGIQVPGSCFLLPGTDTASPHVGILRPLEDFSVLALAMLMNMVLALD